MVFVVTKPVTIAGVTHAIGDVIEHLEASVLADVAHALVPIAKQSEAVAADVRAEVATLKADAIAFEKDVAEDARRSFGRLAPPVKDAPSAATDVQEN